MNIYGDNFFLALGNGSIFDLKLLKWRNFKKLLNFIKGLCTHTRMRTHFFWQVLLSCLHIPSVRVQVMSLSFFFFVLLYWGSLIQNLKRNPLVIMPTQPMSCQLFSNFPLTLRCTPCVRHGFASRHCYGTPGCLLIILLLNEVIFYS